MSKSLVLAEKPSVAKDIARVLGCKAGGSSFYESSKYIVTWGYGHLVTLATPDRYQKNYEVWKMEDLPILPNPFLLDVIPKTSKHFHQVVGLMRRPEVNEIIIATDAGREGELVARWILDKGVIKKPLKRLWISSVTDRAIQEGFSKLRNGKEYDALYEAAKARAYADWIVGLNATRALTCHFGASLSCGRVQTPTLQLIEEREASIRDFKGVEYWQIHGKIQNMNFTYRKSDTKETRIFSYTETQEVLNEVKDRQGKVQEIDRSEKVSYAPELYDLTGLQRDANRIFGYSAKETLNIMQSLYEHHKILTYPRTDSRYIGKDVAATLGDRLKAIQIGPYKGFVSEILRKPIKQSTHFVNDQKVSDHHAIIPTEQYVKLQDLSPKEVKIYDLVIRRFLAVLMEPYRYEQIKVKVIFGRYEFTAANLYDKVLGYKALYTGHQALDEEMQKNEKSGPLLMKQGESVYIKDLLTEKLVTKPKALLTEGELLGLMEKHGLGTVATRGDIIEKVLQNAYVDKQNQSLRLTKTGKQLLEIVPKGLKEIDLTSRWEKDLERIAKGGMKSEQFLKDMTEYAKMAVTEIKGSTHKFISDNVSVEKCPNCGKNLIEVNNKYGKKLVCQDKGCGYKKQLLQASNARCPDCHKKMNLVGEGEAKTFICSCGHKERLSSFEKRKNAEGAKVSKKEVQSYLKNHQEQELANNPFADLMNLIDIPKK